MNKKPFLIGIAGGTGSGKSTFSGSLQKMYPGDLLIIPYDNYYKSQEGLTDEEKAKVNYDCPDVLDTKILINNLKDLIKGNNAEIPLYDFATHLRKKEVLDVAPKPIIMVDGIMTFHDENLREMFDLKIFVDSPEEERLKRRIERDQKERGRDKEGIIKQFMETVKPMHEKYVEPTKAYADIVSMGGFDDKALRKVATIIKSKNIGKEE